MKKFGKVSAQFWISPDIEGLSDQAKLMAVYLLTTGHGNLIGIFRMPRGYMAADLGWDMASVERAIAELLASNFLLTAGQGDYICIPQFMEHNPVDNITQVDARLKLLKKLPGRLPDEMPEAVPVIERAIQKACEYTGSKYTKGLIESARQLLGKRSEQSRLENKRNREIENKEKEYVRSDDRTTEPEAKLSLSDHFDQWWAAYPKREGDKGHKAQSFSRYKTRLKEPGNTHAALMHNLLAYGRYCDQTDVTGSQYVKTTTAYLNNPENVRNSWTVNHAARQGAAGRPSPLDQFLEANAEHYQPEPVNGGYHPEADSRPVWDHDRSVRGEVDEGARIGGSDGAVAGDFAGPEPEPEPVSTGHSTGAAGREGLATVSTGVSEAVPAPAGRHWSAADGESLA